MPQTDFTDSEDELFEQLASTGRTLTQQQVTSIQEELKKTHVKSNPKLELELRVKLLAYYSQSSARLKNPTSNKALFEHTRYFIQCKPNATGYLRSRFHVIGHMFRPKYFAALRQAWLEQVSQHPEDGTVVGNAASFIAWNDLETASSLFERAYELQPEEGWLTSYLIHYNALLERVPRIYRTEMQEQIVEIAVRSLKSERSSAFMVCAYLADSALELGYFDLVRWSCDILGTWKHATCKQEADAYLGLVALRENRREEAVRLMLKTAAGYRPMDVVFRLASELFDAGERDSIIQLISSFKGKVKASVRNRWLSQIASGKSPDFEGY